MAENIEQRGTSPRHDVTSRSDLIGTSLDFNEMSPDLNHTSPDLNHTSPDLNHTSPDLNHTSFDLNHTSPDLNHTSFDLNHTSFDLNHTSPDPSITSPTLGSTSSGANEVALVDGGSTSGLDMDVTAMPDVTGSWPANTNLSLAVSPGDDWSSDLLRNVSTDPSTTTRRFPADRDNVSTAPARVNSSSDTNYTSASGREFVRTFEEATTDTATVASLTFLWSLLLLVALLCNVVLLAVVSSQPKHARQAYACYIGCAAVVHVLIIPLFAYVDVWHAIVGVAHTHAVVSLCVLLVLQWLRALSGWLYTALALDGYVSLNWPAVRLRRCSSRAAVQVLSVGAGILLLGFSVIGLLAGFRCDGGRCPVVGRTVPGFNAGSPALGRHFMFAIIAIRDVLPSVVALIAVARVVQLIRRRNEAQPEVAKMDETIGSNILKMNAMTRSLLAPILLVSVTSLLMSVSELEVTPWPVWLVVQSFALIRLSVLPLLTLSSANIRRTLARLACCFRPTASRLLGVVPFRRRRARTRLLAGDEKPGTTRSISLVSIATFPKLGRVSVLREQYVLPVEMHLTSCQQGNSAALGAASDDGGRTARERRSSTADVARGWTRTKRSKSRRPVQPKELVELEELGSADCGTETICSTEISYT